MSYCCSETRATFALLYTVKLTFEAAYCLKTVLRQLFMSCSWFWS